MKHVGVRVLEDARDPVERRIVPIPGEVYIGFEDRASYRETQMTCPPWRSRCSVASVEVCVEP